MDRFTIARDGGHDGGHGAGAYRVEGLSRAGGGQNNDVFFGRSCESGLPVVVKIEGAPGRLYAEARALAWLARRGVPVPGLLHSGPVLAVGGPPGAAYSAPGPGHNGGADPARYAGRFALVLERLAGRAPVAPSDWRVMGETLARLRAVPLRGAPWPAVRAPAGFAASHEALGRALAAELPEPHGAAVAAALRAAGGPPGLSAPVLTHGDPGPGNFLLCGGRGHLLDWETVQAAPAGLDPARAAFLALLNAAGRADAAEARARADAVWEGYDATARSGPFPAPARRWWTAVAGLQFTANRWRRRAEPRILPWEDAVATLTAAVARASRAPGAGPGPATSVDAVMDAGPDVASGAGADC